ncbi:metallophosphoesterase [Anaerococcus hydrogenalis]|uniref:Ser/Thr phosphatase family protein n=1 Tax=Anaerococcus hydrogenalis ACS-025-V-Sch4 TaxID=879306 RepID=F0GZM5_9FIRM|nr:metallophosphoesterase [Anaerococcus hydrogenalis]EGC84342.1 Ser/Thr phosphatase family protein [Anaerococcus hydrogenalis ACS-025-V-Sch4]
MIYAIADLHLDYTEKKSMEIFGKARDNYQDKIFNNWNKIVKKEDTVLISGDISWAMDIYNAFIDLKKLDQLNGRKIMLKGNHDYWWQSLKKLNDLELETIDFLQNNSFFVEGYDICGTRGWISRDNSEFTDHDEKIFKRELQRLKNSLQYNRENKKKIVMLHYPPINSDRTLNEFFGICKDFQVKCVIYGHLHGQGHKQIIEGIVDGIEIKCVAGDYIDFLPERIS